MNKHGNIGVFIGMMVVWFVLTLDGLVPTIVGALIGGTVGQMVGGLLATGKKRISRPQHPASRRSRRASSRSLQKP